MTFTDQYNPLLLNTSINFFYKKKNITDTKLFEL